MNTKERGAHLADEIVEAACCAWLAGIPKQAQVPVSCSTVIAAIVAAVNDPREEANKNVNLQVVGLGAGTRCTHPASHPEVAAVSVSDCHAEILAKRAAVSYFMREAVALTANFFSEKKNDRSSSAEKFFFHASSLLEPIFCHAQHLTGFRLKPGVKLHLCVTQPPCGDSCIVASSQQSTTPDHTTNHEGGARAVRPVKTATDCLPHEDFVAAGFAVSRHKNGVDDEIPLLPRVKPGKGRPSLCMCCSDKIAQWVACGSFGGTVTAPILGPLPLASIVLACHCANIFEKEENDGLKSQNEQRHICAYCLTVAEATFRAVNRGGGSTPVYVADKQSSARMQKLASPMRPGRGGNNSGATPLRSKRVKRSRTDEELCGNTVEGHSEGETSGTLLMWGAGIAAFPQVSLVRCFTTSSPVPAFVVDQINTKDGIKLGVTMTSLVKPKMRGASIPSSTHDLAFEISELRSFLQNDMESERKYFNSRALNISRSRIGHMVLQLLILFESAHTEEKEKQITNRIGTYHDLKEYCRTQVPASESYYTNKNRFLHSVPFADDRSVDPKGTRWVKKAHAFEFDIR